MDLILDIKHLIASLNSEAWYWMFQLDNEFKIYAASTEGIREYKKIHTHVSINEEYTEYKLFGKRHREDGPAFIHIHGTQSWYYKGELHRKNGPAIIWNDGSKSWYTHGKYGMY